MTDALQRWSLPQRLALVAVGALGLTLLMLVRTLQPDPRGFGTHEQVGIPPCYFQELTGKRCPMCGGTTAWALVVRGKLVQAVNVHLGATLLCVAVAIGSLWLIWEAVRRPKRLSWPTWRFMLVMASAWWAVVVLDWLRRLL